MSRQTKDKAEKTRARILASALVLFARKGYERTTFTDIAERLRLTKGAVYWHFDSKERLLLAVIDDMMARFGRQLAAMAPSIELTYPVVSAVLSRYFARMLKSARSRACFQLLHRQIHWADASMAVVRHELLTNRRFGPWEAFHAALVNDVRAGRAKAGTDPNQVASASIALVSGLLDARMTGFLTCDFEQTVRLALDALWAHVRTAAVV
ncbi:MAG: TetR/AcrR family transcriptional regulator [Kiritimatiellia bacterium]